MSKIAVISEHYYPYNNDANTACTEKIMKELAKCGNDVTVFTKCFVDSIPRREKRDGYNIVRSFFNKQELIDKRFNIKTVNKITDIIVMILTSLTYKTEMVKVRKFYTEEIRNGNFDCILSIANPVMNHTTAKFIKKRVKDICWTAYYYDPYSCNDETGKLEAVKRKIHERLLMKKVDKVISFYGIIAEYNDRNFHPFPKNVRILETPLPNLVINECTAADKPSDGKVHLLYAGRLYSDLMNPDALIDFLDKLNSEEYVADFYGICCDFLKERYPKLPECVKLHGVVCADECKKVMQNSDIMLNLGYNCQNHTPSKIFEYIGACKPIINIYYNDNDTGLRYLKKYPGALNIKTGNKRDINKAEDFCKNATNIDAEVIREIYSDFLCENVVKRISAFLQ